MDSFVDLLNESAKDGIGRQESSVTAAMFMSMADRDLLNYFVNVRGVDYDEAGFSLEESLKDELNYKTDLQVVEQLYAHPSIPASNLYLNDYSTGSAKCGNAPANLFGKPIQEKQSLLRLINDHLSKDANNEPTNSANENSTKSLPPYTEGEQGRVIKKRKPRTYKYNPKPVLQKESRSFVPDDLKDNEYWERRKRNNQAAKKSREERRKKELEIMGDYHEVKTECESLRSENQQMKLYIDRLEQRLEDLERKVLVVPKRESTKTTTTVIHQAQVVKL